MVKPKSKRSVKPAPDIKAIDLLADSMADKPYGNLPEEPKKQVSPEKTTKEELVPITVTIPVEMRDQLDQLVLKRKREKAEDRTVSAIVRKAIDQHVSKL